MFKLKDTSFYNRDKKAPGLEFYSVDCVDSCLPFKDNGNAIDVGATNLALNKILGLAGFEDLIGAVGIRDCNRDKNLGIDGILYGDVFKVGPDKDELFSLFIDLRKGQGAKIDVENGDEESVSKDHIDHLKADLVIFNSLFDGKDSFDGKESLDRINDDISCLKRVLEFYHNLKQDKSNSLDSLDRINEFNDLIGDSKVTNVLSANKLSDLSINFSQSDYDKVEGLVLGLRFQSELLKRLKVSKLDLNEMKKILLSLESKIAQYELQIKSRTELLTNLDTVRNFLILNLGDILMLKTSEGTESVNNLKEKKEKASAVNCIVNHSASQTGIEAVYLEKALLVDRLTKLNADRVECSTAMSGLQGQIDEIRNSFPDDFGYNSIIELIQQFIKDGGDKIKKKLGTELGSIGDNILVKNYFEGYFSTISTIWKELSGVNKNFDKLNKSLQECLQGKEASKKLPAGMINTDKLDEQIARLKNEFEPIDFDKKSLERKLGNLSSEIGYSKGLVAILLNTMGGQSDHKLQDKKLLDDYKKLIDELDKQRSRYDKITTRIVGLLKEESYLDTKIVRMGTNHSEVLSPNVSKDSILDLPGIRLREISLREKLKELKERRFELSSALQNPDVRDIDRQSRIKRFKECDNEINEIVNQLLSKEFDAVRIKPIKKKEKKDDKKDGKTK